MLVISCIYVMFCIRCLDNYRLVGPASVHEVACACILMVGDGTKISGLVHYTSDWFLNLHRDIVTTI